MCNIPVPSLGMSLLAGLPSMELSEVWLIGSMIGYLATDDELRDSKNVYREGTEAESKLPGF